ncbi:MAG TPA: hypothetical protein VF112_00680 [Candidatus Dormibacteraeota bacterium]
MPGSSRVFRQEALEHHAGGQRWGERLDLGTRWARRAPLALLALVLPLVIAGLAVHVDDSATGRFVADSDGAGVAVVLPASARAPLSQGTPLDLQLSGGRRLAVRVGATDIEPLSSEDARARFGSPATAGLLATSSPLILVQTSIDPVLPDGQRGSGTATVRLDSRALIPMLLSGLFDRGPGG